MLVCIFGGGVSRVRAFVCGKAFENSDPNLAAGLVGGANGHSGAVVKLRRGMAIVLGGADVQLAVVDRVVGVLERIPVCAAAVLCIVIVGDTEFATHP